MTVNNSVIQYKFRDECFIRVFAFDEIWTATGYGDCDNVSCLIFKIMK